MPSISSYARPIAGIDFSNADVIPPHTGQLLSALGKITWFHGCRTPASYTGWTSHALVSISVSLMPPFPHQIWNPRSGSASAAM